LFAGPDGVGKKTVALLLAGRVNCRNPSGNDLCGECGSCVKAISGNHPDIQLFRTDQEKISIDSMRRLSREAQFRPFEGELRFFVIDEAEKMSEEAANSILKTLEEPPDTTRIILISAYPQRLLPTILSRCQTFPFRALSQEEISAYLRKCSDLGEIEMRAAFSEGSLGNALELNIEEALEQRDLMLDFLVRWFQDPSFEGVFQRCESRPLSTELKRRDKVRRYLDLLQSLCYDIYFLLIGAAQRVVNVDRREELGTLSQEISLEQIRDLLYHIAESQRDVDRYVSPLICFETLWLGPARDRRIRC
jgi:DNA polymerase-3 subunit delta'